MAPKGPEQGIVGDGERRHKALDAARAFRDAFVVKSIGSVISVSLWLNGYAIAVEGALATSQRF